MNGDEKWKFSINSISSEKNSILSESVKNKGSGGRAPSQEPATKAYDQQQQQTGGAQSPYKKSRKA